MEGKSSVRVGEYSTYIFDLDGTLFTLPVDWASARRELAAVMGEEIGDSPLFLKLNAVIASKPALKQRLFATIDSYELRASASARPMPGATELVYNLFETAKLGLVTMQGARVTHEILGRHKLADLFEVVITREDSTDRADQILMAANRLKAKTGDVLFTGDRINDVVAARRAGVDVVLVGRSQDVEPKPNYAFPSLVELKAYLG